MIFKEKNDIDALCMEYAVKVVECVRQIVKEKKEFKMTDQLLRAGTSIGANYGEAKFSESDVDYIHKVKIALKECNESQYWLELLHKSNFLEEEKCQKLYEMAREIERLLTSCMVKAQAKCGK
ncbi:MAG: four helix bundle protein [Paludibacteraceae bacterium]|nr:four helix bundle protein [Paludibacteraceae bacterium]